MGRGIISALIPSCSAKSLPGSQLLPGACGGSSGPDKLTEITLSTKAVWQACQSEPCPGLQAPGRCVSRRWVCAPFGQGPSLCVEAQDAMLALGCSGVARQGTDGGASQGPGVLYRCPAPDTDQLCNRNPSPSLASPVPVGKQPLLTPPRYFLR